MHNIYDHTEHNRVFCFNETSSLLKRKGFSIINTQWFESFQKYGNSHPSSLLGGEQSGETETQQV